MSVRQTDEEIAATWRCVNLNAAEQFMSAGYAPTAQLLVDEYLVDKLVWQPAIRGRVKFPPKPDQPMAPFEATLRRIQRMIHAPLVDRKKDQKLFEPSALDIARAIAAKHSVDFKEMRGPRRNKNFVRARQEAFYTISKLRGLSLPQIGRMFGDRDHTTVLHGIRAHAKRNGLPR